MASGYPDYEGDKQRVYLVPEWAAKEAVDKNFLIVAEDKSYGQNGYAEYEVPVGKTLYICGFSFSIYAVAVANADLNQIGHCYIYNATTASTVGMVGGNGGGGILLSKSIVFTAGQTFRLIAAVLANHNCDIYATAWGYEV